MDPEDRHLRGNSFFMYRQLFFTCAFHGPPSGIQVSLTHSLAIMFMTFGKKTKVAAMQHVFQNLHRRLASVSKHNADMAASAVEWIRSCNMSCPKMFGNISDLLALV